MACKETRVKLTLQHPKCAVDNTRNKDGKELIPDVQITHIKCSQTQEGAHKSMKEYH